MTNSIPEIRDADFLFVIGSNTSEAHPIIAMEMKRAVGRGATMVVADPRAVWMTTIAEKHLQIAPGSDVWLLNAMAHVIVTEGLVDQSFIDEHTENFESVRETVMRYTPEEAERVTGISADDIRWVARRYATTEKAGIYYTLGITEHICGVDNVQSLCNLALMTGNLGKEGAGINPMRGQNNIQGAGDCGALPNNYPGFQPVHLEENQRKFEEAWGVQVDLEKGITKVRALETCGEKIFSMLICGENTVVTDPDMDHCRHALQSLDHLVVVDMFLTETAQLADVVLPASGWGETDGVFTNTERRPQRVRAAVPPQGEAQPDWWIMSQIAKRLGSDQFEYESARDVFNEMCSLATTYNGLDWDRIEGGAYQWPVPDKDHPGTPVLHIGEFPRGKGLFMTPDYRDPAEVVDDDYPVWLTTGRRLAHYHTRTMSGRSVGTEYLVPEELVEVHPDDVTSWGLEDGGLAVMSSRRGEVVVKVSADDTSPRGTVFCSFSFSDVPVNKLTGSGYDPITDTAELKVCAVKIEPVTTEL